MSTAFDIVDHSILLQKLQLYGFRQCSLQWVESYLSERFQTVCIDGCLSKYSEVEFGVPQGSILGPLLYTLYTNELPEVVHCHQQEIFQEDNPMMYKDPNVLSEMRSRKYEVISEFLASNRLKLNDKKN